MRVPIATPAQVAERCTRLPVFPLPRVVFLPHTLLPLHVFEPRYRALVADLVDGDGLLGVPTLGDRWQEDYDGRPAIHEVMGVGQLVRHQALPDGCSNIVLVGLGRARLRGELDTDKPYRVLDTELLEDVAPSGGRALAAAATSIRVAIDQLMRARPETAEHLSTLLDPQRRPHEMVDALAHLALRQPEDRQRYLELDGVEARVEMVLASIATAMCMGSGPASA